MQIYLISGRLVVAKDAADARAKTGVAYKDSVMNLTHKLKALCQQVLGDKVFIGCDTVGVQALRREEEEHAHTRRLLEEQSASYRELFDKHQKLSNEMIVANGRVAALEKDVTDQARTIRDRNSALEDASSVNLKLSGRLERAEAALVEARAEIERLQVQIKSTVFVGPETAPPLTADELGQKLIEFAKTSPSPEGDETPLSLDTLPAGAVTLALSPISEKHGRAVMQLLDLGHNPDEVVQEINARLPRNDHITTGLVKKIKVEMTQYLHALNRATLNKAKRA
jgi:hypothetical protein